MKASHIPLSHPGPVVACFERGLRGQLGARTEQYVRKDSVLAFELPVNACTSQVLISGHVSVPASHGMAFSWHGIS